MLVSYSVSYVYNNFCINELRPEQKGRVFSDSVHRTERHGSAQYHCAANRGLQPPAVRSAEE
jgi:hypothetical protein